ncbi:hypothetical protein E1B28_008438 [Marasmius oreades]|uniref:Glycosyltransferase 2-like domain-containing protein n=1 Tax=Marasmius oreades TaxID=181124 RepID=A0A9P7URS0_9AGAR|nr:uncharacterized protein E1B28_008438 [Marasmius oreades]KAG7092057.1 hypothetical protein E1B28_008438 [Marasmius oreades]
MDYDRWDALLHHIFKQTQGDAWFRPQEENISSGVAIRIHDDPPEFRVFPYENVSLEPFEVAVRSLNPVVAVKVRSAAVHAALAHVDPNEHSLYIDANTCIQILDTMLDLGKADKEQRAAFLRDERVLVVWASSLENIIPTCQDFEERMIKFLWRSRPVDSNVSALSSSSPNSVAGHESHPDSLLARPLHLEQEPAPISSSESSIPPPVTVKKRTWYGKTKTVTVPSKDFVHPRPTLLYAPLYNGLAAGLSFVFIGNGARVLVWEFLMDGQFIRFVLCVTLPLLYCISLFFALQILQNLTMAFGPIAHYHRNSKYYSAIPPPPIPSSSSSNAQRKEPLPHITIQMPVYKESLDLVLKPSVASLKAAMRTYALQGGTSSLLMFDDGLRATGMTAADRNERIKFYREEDIGWCARPREGCPADTDTNDQPTDVEKGLFRREKTSSKGKSKEDTFHRPGRFKKASNLNYGLALSLCVERWLEVLLREREEGKRHVQQPTLQQLVGEERRISEFTYPPTSPISSWGRNTVVSGYGMQYLNRDGDDMFSTSSVTDSPPTPGYGQSAILSPIPRSPSAFSPLMGTPGTPSETSTPPASTPGRETPTLHDDIEEQALKLAIEDMYTQSGRKWKPWAANARAMRVGEIVLLVDSDTEVPEDCLRDAAREMHHSPSLAIIQHESDVMQVARHYFENGIAYFTRRVNKCIGIACANGEVAPFVGHNAFLRWRAIQDAAYVDSTLSEKNTESKTKIWSEWNVSEDFDMALRLLKKGYTIRWATYSKGGFKEGVSLTVDDELNRWMKYAYGCNELLFNPLYQWIYRGPISKQIHTFVWSNAPLHYKFSVMAYMFSYYGLACSILISLLNYVLLAFQFPIDGFYLHSWEIWLAVTVVFTGSGNVAYTLVQYRLGEKSLIKALLENLMWIPFFFFFFGGLAIPVSQAILAHLFSVNITWSATKKEVERSNFFKEIPRIVKRFWFPLVVSVVIIAGMVISSTALVPIEWRVGGEEWAAIFPLAVVASCHILFPILLNPWLMVFSY